MAALVIAGFSAVVDTAAAGERICKYCSTAIEGAHFESGADYYHPDHFRCEYCSDRISGPYTEYKDKNYHSECFRTQIALRCALCEDIVEGEYLLDFWGNAYHLHHREDTPACDSCSRFLSPATTGGGVRYDDGRYVCGICHESSVTDIDVIMRLIEEVGRYMDSFGMTVDYKGLEVHLIGQDQMRDLAGEHSSGLRGFTDYSEDWRLFGRAKNRKLNVYFLYGMPRIELISTISHELGHVWQFNHGRFENDKAWAEGSCNFASYLVLGRYSDKEADFFRHSIAADENRIYGEGFRRVKRYVDDKGVDAWLKQLRKKPGFPRSY